MLTVIDDAGFMAGRHEAMLITLQTDVSGIKTDITAIKGILSERRGERKIGAWGAHTLSAAVGAIATLVAHYWTGGR